MCPKEKTNFVKKQNLFHTAPKKAQNFGRAEPVKIPFQLRFCHTAFVPWNLTNARDIFSVPQTSCEETPGVAEARNIRRRSPRPASHIRNEMTEPDPGYLQLEDTRHASSHSKRPSRSRRHIDAQSAEDIYAEAVDQSAAHTEQLPSPTRKSSRHRNQSPTVPFPVSNVAATGTLQTAPGTETGGSGHQSQVSSGVRRRSPVAAAGSGARDAAASLHVHVSEQSTPLAQGPVSRLVDGIAPADLDADSVEGRRPRRRSAIAAEKSIADSIYNFEEEAAPTKPLRQYINEEASAPSKFHLDNPKDDAELLGEFHPVEKSTLRSPRKSSRFRQLSAVTDQADHMPVDQTVSDAGPTLRTSRHSKNATAEAKDELGDDTPASEHFDAKRPRMDENIVAVAGDRR